MNFIYYAYLFFIGSSFASFYYLLAARIPRREKVVWTRSKCESCHTRLGFWDLFPVFSYFYLKGRCRYCGHSLSAAYCIFELVGGIFFIQNGLHYITSPRMFLFYMFLYSILFLIAAIDQQYFIIPDSLQVILFLLLLVDRYLSGASFDKSCLYGLVGMFAVGFLASAMVPEGLGGGDIKLMSLFGLNLGFYNASFVLCFAALLGLLSISFSHIFYKRNLSSPIPFGPFLVISFWLIKEGILQL